MTTTKKTKTFYVHVALEFVTFLDLASSVIRSMLRTSHVVKNFTWKGLTKKYLKKKIKNCITILHLKKKKKKVYFLKYSIGPTRMREAYLQETVFVHCTS